MVGVYQKPFCRHDRHSFTQRWNRSSAVPTRLLALLCTWGTFSWPLKANPSRGAARSLHASIYGWGFARWPFPAGRDSNEDEVAAAALGRMDAADAGGCGHHKRL